MTAYHTTLSQNFDDVTLCLFLRQSWKKSLNFIKFVSLMVSGPLTVVVLQNKTKITLVVIQI